MCVFEADEVVVGLAVAGFGGEADVGVVFEEGGAAGNGFWCFGGGGEGRGGDGGADEFAETVVDEGGVGGH